VYDEPLKTALTPIGLDGLDLNVAVKTSALTSVGSEPVPVVDEVDQEAAVAAGWSMAGE
jgi:hypothetical protein